MVSYTYDPTVTNVPHGDGQKREVMMTTNIPTQAPGRKEISGQKVLRTDIDRCLIGNLRFNSRLPSSLDILQNRSQRLISTSKGVEPWRCECKVKNNVIS